MNDPNQHGLTAHPTADLLDANPQAQVCSARLIDFGGRRMFAGRIRTVATMRDSKLAMELFRTRGDGAVVVVDGGGSMATALLGDNNAAILADNGWAGIIINGALRDAEQMGAIDLGIKALGTCPRRPSKHGIGAIDVPVAFGEILFTPGHCVYCDRDGVIVSADPLAPG